MKRNIFEFISRKIFKVKRGCMLPWHMRLLYFVLFPVVMIKEFLYSSGPVRYDWETYTITIYGIKYSRELFKSGFKVGNKIEIIERRNGIITFKSLNKIVDDWINKVLDEG